MTFTARIVFCGGVLGLGLVLVAAQNTHADGVTVTTTQPYYGATYGGAGISAADAKKLIEHTEMSLAEQKRTNELLEQLLQKLGGEVKAAAKLDKGKVAQAKCAGCHIPAAAEKKGGGFVLFASDDGKTLNALSKRDSTNLRRLVTEGTMPPGGKLPPAELRAMTE